MKKRGRKPWLPTPEIIAKIQDLAAQGLTHEQIYYSIGISCDTWYTKIEEFPEISEAYKKGKAKGIGFVTNKLMNHVQKDNLTAAIFYLKCQAGWKEQEAPAPSQPLVIKVNGKVVELD
jgi:hypothetical protein